MTRCEVGISGFVSLDVFRMLSLELASKMGAPTGSTFLAPQTCHNLQSACLSGVVMCLVKHEAWKCWDHGHARLSELSIEEWFSYCRRQSPNAQLSARGFFSASARVALKNGRLLNQEKAPSFIQTERALTDDEFLDSIL